MNPSRRDKIDLKEKYARELAKELKIQGFNKIEYTEHGEGMRGIKVNDSQTEETLSDNDINSIDILIMTLSGLPNILPEMDLKVSSPKTSINLEGIEIIVALRI